MRVRAVGGARERRPHVELERGGVVDPGAPVAELLRERDLLGGLGHGREGAGDVHGLSDVTKDRAQAAARGPRHATRDRYSTVTDFARLRGWSTSQPRRTAM